MQDGRFVILYIDDDQDYLDAVREMLEAEGTYTMAEALSAEDRRLMRACQPAPDGFNTRSPRFLRGLRQCSKEAHRRGR